MKPTEYLEKLRGGSVSRELPFSLDEYHERVSKVRKVMGHQGFDALLIFQPANIHYLTGYTTFSVGETCILVLPLEGDPALHVGATEIPAALMSGWIDDVHPYNWNELEQIGPGLTSTLKEKGLESKRIGLELERGGYVLGLHQELEMALPGITFVDASSLIQGVKVVKSSTELEYMRRAGAMTWAGIEASYAAIRPGVTDTEVARAAHDGIMGAGSDFLCGNPIVNSGERSSWHHATHRRVPINVGDTVFMEYSGCYERYNAPMMRTAVVGPPSDDVKRISEAVKETVSLVIDGAKAGRTSHDVAAGARRGYESLESEVWYMGVCGYSVGAEFPPGWADCPVKIGEGVDIVLKPGMTFHLPIMFRVPGKFGVGMSETIAITETGCEVLTQQERSLHVV